jgi:hypothetical protein
MASAKQFLTRRLKLKVNSAKSAVARPSARKFLGFSFTSETASHRAAGAGPVHQPGAGADPAHAGREPGPSHRSAVGLSDGLAGLFRVLSDRLGLARPGRMGTAAVALSGLGAMALRAAALPRLASTRDQHAAGGHYGGRSTRPWPMAAQPAPRSPGRLANHLLRRPWPANPGAGRLMMPPPNRRVWTRMHGRGRGEAARLPPIPIEHQ